MSDRCPECGYLPADYLSAPDRRWATRAFAAIADHMFEGVDGSGQTPIGAYRTARDLAAHLASLAPGGTEADFHSAVHETLRLATISAGIARGVRPLLQGSVAQVSTSRGGVPKRPREVPVAVGWRGLAEDRQRERAHHGHAFQAVCLYSIEVIEALAAEGHPIAAGSAGENLTLEGIDWASLHTGTVLGFGDLLVLEVTGAATPCNKNAQWFKGGRFDRMDHDKHPGWSRWYAAVLTPGEVCRGDKVRELDHRLSPLVDRSGSCQPA
jgi:MOSC domain-containing protein YiiM